MYGQPDQRSDNIMSTCTIDDNFVAVFDDYLPPTWCDRAIEYCEWCAANNRTWERTETTTSIKNDNSTTLNPISSEEINFTYENLTPIISEFNKAFWDECYPQYLKKYDVLAQYGKHTIYSYKIQKTLPGGGYHIWHSEDGSVPYSRRVGVYIVYLNDVEEGGETEFLYLSKRYAPKKGRIIVFPPNFPWAHRGNPPLSGAKYIMTGWLEFQ